MTMSELCDDILRVCHQTPDQPISPTFDFENLYSARGVARTRTRGALLHLEKVGYIVKPNEKAYVLTAVGELFAEGNGYAGEKERQKEIKREREQDRRHTFWIALLALVVSFGSLIVSTIK